MATIGSFPVKILAQCGDSEPVYVGVYHMGVNADSPDGDGIVNLTAAGFLEIESTNEV